MDTNDRRARGRRGRLLIAAGAVVLLVALGGSPASANSPGRTQGDAKAAFEAQLTAGFTIGFREQGVPNGGPAGGLVVGSTRETVRIYPNADFSYCASGWHVIYLSWWDAVGYYENLGGLVAYLASVDIQYNWDGVPLVEQRTAIKRLNNFPNPEFADAFAFNTGTFMPPGSLTVGEHTLTTAITDPLYGNDSVSVEVTILPC
jgi:hypothetical protein